MKAHPLITAGTKVTWKGYLGVVIETPDQQNDVLIQLDSEEELTLVKYCELHPLRDISSDQNAIPLTRIDANAWDKAERRALMCRWISQQPHVTAAIEAAAVELGTSTKTVRRALERHREDQRTSSLLARTAGRKKGTRLLKSDVEDIIDAGLNEFFLTRERPKLSLAIDAITIRCRSQGLTPPSATTVRRRALMLKPGYVVKRREGAKKFRLTYTPVPGSLKTNELLQTVEIDHTQGDIILVSDDADRRPIGRPWITLAVCTTSRAVVGLYISFEKPSTVSLAMCILSVLIPKMQLIRHAGLKMHAEWPCSGDINKLQWDNGKEMHGDGVIRGAANHGISVEYRPVGLPHWGGMIERLIGTFMGRLPLIPGATQRDVRARAKHDVEKAACMTLQEFRQWFVTEITTQYHQTVHRALGVTPLQKWLKLVPQDQVPHTDWTEEQILRCFVDFLPFEMRAITRQGIWLHGVRYWSDGLAPFVSDQQAHAIRYDPRSMKRVYFMSPIGEVIIAECTTSVPDVSLREYRRMKVEQKQHGLDGIDWATRTTGFEANQVHLKQCKREQRKANREYHKRLERHKDIEKVVKLATVQPKTAQPTSEISEYRVPHPFRTTEL
jgi:putative transposase